MNLSNNTYLIQIKSECLQNKNVGLKDYFATSLAIHDTRIIREQKILFLISDISVLKETVEIYLHCLKSKLSRDEFEKESIYLEFVLVISTVAKNYQDQAQILIGNLSSHSIQSLIQSLSAYWITYTHQIHRELFDDISNSIKSSDTAQKQADLSEWMMHKLNGILLDAQFALARVINEFAEHHPNHFPENAAPVDSPESIEALLSVCSKLNLFDFCIDKISYGDWAIDTLTEKSGKFSLTFEIIDKQYEKSRELAIRRSLSSQQLQKNTRRWLNQSLESYAEAQTKSAIEYYSNNGILIINNDDYRAILDHVKFQMNCLEAEDEFLIGENLQSEFICYYLFRLSIVCYQSVSAKYQDKYPDHLKNRFFTPEFPANRILADEMFTDIDKELVLTVFVCKLPANSYFDILHKPLIQLTSNRYYLIPIAATQNWIWQVRSILMQGGKTGDQIGKVWENYVAETFSSFGWEVVAKNKKINKELPDIDLFLYRDGLILLTQIKAVYINGSNTFEQWKAKQKIIKGAEQAIKIKTAIESDKDVMSRITQLVKPRPINQIYSFVITNYELFNGWKYKDMSVLGVKGLMQIFRGANVDFMGVNKNVVETKRFAAGVTLTNDEFLSFIAYPLDFRLADLTDHIEFHVEDIEEITINIPQLTRSDNLNARKIISEKK